MLIDLISSANMVTYNTRIAHLLGLHPAIYLSELLSINDKAIRKDKLVDECFILNREYITSRTTLPMEEQIDIENKLMDIGVLCKDPFDKNKMFLNTENVVSLLMSEDEKIIGNVQNIMKKPAKRLSKQDQMILVLQGFIVTQNDELRSAYMDWIDASVKRNGWLSKASVTEAQSLVDTVSCRDLDIALNIVKIAAVNGYRDMQWAIEKYTKGGGRLPKQQQENNKIKVGDEEF